MKVLEDISKRKAEMSGSLGILALFTAALPFIYPDKRNKSRR